MIPEFSRLTEEEVELMHKAPILVSILIAGADDHIDRNEIKKVIDLTGKKFKKENSRLLPFYREVGEDFEDKLKILLQEFPLREADRAPKIVEQLSQVSSVLTKIEKGFAGELYLSLKEIAEAVARSSGGLLGLSKVHDKEATYLKLEMIKSPV
jgi:hypothetical protein